jgi:hypothetical protein
VSFEKVNGAELIDYILSLKNTGVFDSFLSCKMLRLTIAQFPDRADFDRPSATLTGCGMPVRPTDLGPQTSANHRNGLPHPHPAQTFQVPLTHTHHFLNSSVPCVVTVVSSTKYPSTSKRHIWTSGCPRSIHGGIEGTDSPPCPMAALLAHTWTRPPVCPPRLSIVVQGFVRFYTVLLFYRST